MTIKDYQTEHLFLLIGGNPLPNYVAAKLMTKSKENSKEGEDSKPTIYLIFSQGENGTKKFAEKLREVLGEEKYNLKNLVVKPESQSDIYKKVKDKVAELKDSGVISIGLNYTGGTKAMAVHAHRALKENCGDGIKPCFSYLDSREMKMCIDREDNKDRTEFKLYDPKESHFEATKISLDDLLKLHCLEKSRDPYKNVRLPDYLQAIYKEFANNNENWGKFRGKVQKKYRDAESKETPADNDQFEARLRKKKISIIESELPNLYKTLQVENLIENNELVLANLPMGKSAEEFCKYFSGTWLEDFVLERILEVQGDSSLSNYVSSLEILHPDKKGFPYFEVDVVAIRGYQLFVFTCAISSETNKQYYKGKIFEALSRAEQLGGSEARVALVCTATNNGKNQNGDVTDYVQLLKDELNDKRVTVFGKEDVLDKQQFTNELRGWFETR